MKRTGIACAVLLLLALCGTAAQAVQYVESPPLAKVITAPAGEVKAGAAVQVPMITWGGDQVTIHANGNAAKTAPGSKRG